MEGSQLQARLEEEAVPCLLSGVQADPLVGRIGTGETKERVRIPPLREAGRQSRSAEAVPKLLGTVPAEEPVLRILPGQIEENLDLQGRGYPRALPRRKEGQTEQPAQVEPPNVLRRRGLPVRVLPENRLTRWSIRQ